MSPERTAVVWSSTWVPSASPVAGYGAGGYAVSWVDLVDGTRLQVLVDGAPPEPGTAGRIAERRFGDVVVEMFERSEL